jgi:cell wall hydrolase
MGRSRLSWACTAIAPWCLGLGLVVSITAHAGQDPALGASVAAQAIANLPARTVLLSSTPQLPGDLYDKTSADNLGPEARLILGTPEDLAAIDDEVDPRADLKQAKANFPQVDRSRKGDPFIGLRPGFDARLNHQVASASRQASGPTPDPTFDGAWTPSPPSPAGAQSAPISVRNFDDGSTPTVPLDVALNSSTPTPNDGVRIIVAAKAETTLAPKTTTAGAKPDYASLIDAKDSARQQRCLAEAIYFEARSEPEDGQAAVAQVVLNRVRHGGFASNVCGVVYQDRNHPFACQFSFACEGKSLRVEEPGPWAAAVRIADEVVSGIRYNPLVGEAVSYHANYVRPYWANTMQRVDVIGHHIFYRFRVSQN